MRSLKGRTIILTGATSGLGRALAKKLCANGAELALCGRSPEKLESLLQELKNDRPASGVFARAFCLSSAEQIIKFVTDAREALGGIDVLVNCAGTNVCRTPLAETRIADLDWMYNINCRAAFIFMQQVFRHMREKKQGHIVNVLSTVALFANPTLGAYTASKAALDDLTKVFRKEVRAEGIAVTAVYPGGIDTPFRAQPRPDYMRPETVADAITSLLELDQDAVIHDLVLRPQVEVNY